MLEDTVKKMEDAIRKIDSLKGRDQTELLSLLCALRTEVGHLSETHEEQAHSIASLTEMAAHEATRQENAPAHPSKPRDHNRHPADTSWQARHSPGVFPQEF